LSICESIITHANNLNIDESESVLVNRKTTTIRITDSEIAEVKESLDRSLGIRLVHEKKISTVQTNILEDVPVEKAFRLIQYSKPKTFWKSLPHDFKKKLT
jgi:PmbA protein